MSKISDLAEKLSTGGVQVSVAKDVTQVKGWVDSGNLALNKILSGSYKRGWPMGHIVELFGDPSTGKSFIINRAIATFQRDYPEGVCVLDDTEGAFNAEWAEQVLGIDVDKLLYVRSHTVSEHHALVSNILKELPPDTPILLCLDSSSLLASSHEMEVEFDKVSMTRAKEIRKLFRTLGKYIHDRPVLYLITSHVTAKIGAALFESKRTTTGGTGTKYEASLRLDLRTVKKIKDKNDKTKYTGAIITAFTDKNRITSPWKTTSLAIPFDSPLTYESGLIPAMLGRGEIGENGRHVAVNGEKTSILAHKTDFLKQDESAKLLIEQYPELLDDPAEEE